MSLLGSIIQSLLSGTEAVRYGIPQPQDFVSQLLAEQNRQRQLMLQEQERRRRGLQFGSIYENPRLNDTSRGFVGLLGGSGIDKVGQVFQDPGVRDLFGYGGRDNSFSGPALVNDPRNRELISALLNERKAYLGNLDQNDPNRPIFR